ncbi:hypothetical protein H8E65_07290, partial [Candidatus Bathyarchaeota archaeon]|nr:hypothetical protein [Candidatus Bathyarchaeota archaeon]
MSSEYTPPSFKEVGFHCPHCGVYAHQNWFDVALEGGPDDSGETLSLGTCEKCGRFSLWIDGEMIYPPSADLPLPRVEMPEGVREVYLEARRTLDASPRAASALLRLAIRGLISHLGETDDVAENLEYLNRRGLDEKIQVALRRLRLVGGGAGVPGVICSGGGGGTARVVFRIPDLAVGAVVLRRRWGREYLGG